MSRSGFIRSVSSSLAVAAATLGVIGFANVSFGEAIVGEMRRTALQVREQPLPDTQQPASAIVETIASQLLIAIPVNTGEPSNTLCNRQ